ncbi:envelope stress response activation lipoprotein NlpE [Cronobacter dublinensis]|uniref:envelope stress response activation lipoprotein NlpE n=1 Tax=Cronobacter dublinensis TaxID=413497 RepID=UPI00039A8827|nr:envelope stress response activation lipoprotein NlpE [Cronobacter dublinensis]ALB65705.1 copper homeostasis protein [Cronobacter dublinensis subsp. dublinensis LMG 23823]MDI7273624.1 envelope stress response activation lipoprotein NlpE [Cronobacter dublinensis]
MKKIIFCAAAALSLFSLFGCHNRAEMQTLVPASAAELKPMQQSWKGVLPCADCEGIETALFLEKDGTWVMNQRYQGAKGQAVFASYGTWARTADKLVLTDSQGDKHYFRARGEALEMLDTEGHAIESSLNYRLEPARDPLPVTPMTMTGMYQQNANAVTFTDCATGRQSGVANHATLAHDDQLARAIREKSVLLVVEAHFSMTVDPANGTVQKQLVADRKVAFKPGKDCDNP